jgi:hypothetical protein
VRTPAPTACRPVSREIAIGTAFTEEERARSRLGPRSSCGLVQCRPWKVGLHPIYWTGDTHGWCSTRVVLKV